MSWWRWLRHWNYVHYQPDLGDVVSTHEFGVKKRRCKYCGRKFMDFRG